MSAPIAQSDALFAALTDGSITAPDAAALADRLRADPAALDAYLDYLELHACLTWHLAGPTVTAPIATPPRPAYPISKIENRKPQVRAAKSKISHAFPLALAAALLLAACGVAIVALVSASPNQKSDINNQQSTLPIATLIETTGDVTVGDALAYEGQQYPAGLIAIEAGSAEFLLDGGAGIRLTGRTQLTIHNTMSATLTRGTATFDCPPAAVGYTVGLPDEVRVVDLGTRFAVRLDEAGHALVQVLEGKVRIDTPTGSHELAAGVAHQIVAGVAKPMTDVSRFIVEPPVPPAPPVDPAAFAHAVRELGPVAWWTGDEPVDGAALDAIAQRAATVEGNVTTDGTSDSPHYVLDGGGHFRIDTHDDLTDSGDQLTLMAWVRLDTDAHQAIIHKWARGFAYSLEVHRGHPAFAVAFSNQQGDVIAANPTDAMPLHRWVLLVGVYDGSTVSLYVDGQLAASAPVRNPGARVNRSQGPLTIGRRSDTNDGYVRGAIDDVAVFNRAITPEQVARLYHDTQPDPESETADR